MIISIVTIFGFSALSGVSGAERQKQTSDFDSAGKSAYYPKKIVDSTFTIALTKRYIKELTFT